MQEIPSYTPASYPDQPAPKKNNTGLIIAIIVVLVLCCCCVGGIGCWWLWNNGDSLTGTTGMVLHLI
jgi:hypothetical protein